VLKPSLKGGVCPECLLKEFAVGFSTKVSSCQPAFLPVWALGLTINFKAADEILMCDH